MSAALLSIKVINLTKMLLSYITLTLTNTSCIILLILLLSQFVLSCLFLILGFTTCFPARHAWWSHEAFLSVLPLLNPHYQQLSPVNYQVISIWSLMCEVVGMQNLNTFADPTSWNLYHFSLFLRNSRRWQDKLQRLMIHRFPADTCRDSERTRVCI